MADAQAALLSHLRGKISTDVLREALGGVDGAAARARLKADPNDAEGLALALASARLDGQSNADLVEFAKASAQRASKEDAGNQVALLTGEAVWLLGGSAKAAEPYFRRARRTAPADARVLEFYRDLFNTEADASQLLQVLMQARRAETDVNARYELALEMAELARERLKSVDRAIEVWRSALRESPDPRAHEQLRKLYREGGKWTALVELLKEEFDQLPDEPGQTATRVAKLLEIADLYRDQLRLDAMALTTLQRILDIDPTHEPSLASLAETFMRANRFNDLLGIYNRMEALAVERGDQDARIEVLRKIAALWIDKLGNPQRALEPLASIATLRPTDKESRETLAKIHEQRRDWRALISLRREELTHLQAEEALAVRIELAKLSEDKLGDRREAIADWNAVLEHHGDQDVALNALGRLYERESRWAELAEVLHRQLAIGDDPQRAMRILSALASVYTERLRLSAPAIAVLREHLRLAPGHDKSTRTLRDLYIAEAKWDELTELFREQGKLSSLVETLQGAADRVTDIEQRVELYQRVARLCREELGQPERAVKALERTLAIQPDNFAVARELLPIYREQGNWGRLMGTLEALYTSATDLAERLDLVDALRRVADENLHSPALTFQWAAKAFTLMPSDEVLRSRLEAAAEASDAWDELTAIFEDRIVSPGTDEGERLALLAKLAVIARDKLFKPDDAQRYFRRIVEADPTNNEAISALEQIYTSTRRWDDLASILRKRLEVENDRDRRMTTLRTLARLAQDQLGDLDAAVASLRALLELAPGDVAALDTLIDIYRKRGEWAALCDVLATKLEISAQNLSRLPLRLELGKVRATRLHQYDLACDDLLAVLDDDPNNTAAAQLLEEVRRAEPTLGLRVAKGLLGYYRRTDDKAREAELMEIIVAAAAEGESSDGTSRHDQMRQLAGIYSKMPERKADATRIYGELFASNPGDWDTRQVLTRFAKEQGMMADVAQQYDAALTRLASRAAAAEAQGAPVDRTEMALRRDLLLELAAMQRDDLGRPTDAEASFRKVLEIDETHQLAYESLERLLKQRGVPAELFSLYRHRVDVVFNPREQRELLTHMIELASGPLSDRPLAVRTAEELLDLVPDDIPTIKLLAAMYDQSRETVDREKLEELLGRWAELTEDPVRRRGLTCRRAQVRIADLQDAFGAVDLLGPLVLEAPDHAEARALLEELLDISEVQSQVVSLLEPIYVRMGDHRGRIRALHVRRRLAEERGDMDEATGILLEIAKTEEHEFKDGATAFDVVRDAYLLDPRRADSLRELSRLGRAYGRFQDLIDAYSKVLDGDTLASDRTQRLDLLGRTAELRDRELDDSHGAARDYQRLLDLDPPDADQARRTVTALCRLHLEHGDFISLVRTQRELLRFVDASSEQCKIRLDIARYQLEYLHDRVGAALTYSEVLDIEPANLKALDALEKLFKDEEEWERLCDVLRHRIGVTTDARTLAGLWRRVGDIQRGRLADGDAAVSSFQSVLDLRVAREESVYALTQLKQIHEGAQRWADVEDALRRLTALADKDAERVALLNETAQVVGEKLGRAGDALDLLKRVLDLSPLDSRARGLVATHLDSEDTRERATRILTPLYEAEQNWEQLLSLQELAARKQPSGRRRLQALLKVAATMEDRLGAADRAFGVLAEALTEAGDQPELAEILSKIERLGAEPERAEALLSAYLRTVDHILDAELQKRVLREIGTTAFERLGRTDEARTAFARILETSPDDAHASQMLERILLRNNDHRALAELLERRAERTDVVSERDSLLTRTADIHRNNLSDPERALALYERLSSEALDRAEVQAVMEPLYEATGRYRELAGVLARKLGRLKGRARVETHLRLGRLFGSHLNDPDEGLSHLSAALRLDPDHTVGTDELDRYLEDENMRARAADVLEPIFAGIQDWRRLSKIQEIRLAEAASDEDRIAILHKIAKLEEEQIEDLERAFETYTRILAMDPVSREVRGQISRLANVLAAQARYAEILTSVVDGAADPGDERYLVIAREAADLWLSPTLRNAAKAAPLYGSLVSAYPDDPSLFETYERCLTAAEQWEELVRAYWRVANDSLDEGRQTESLVRVATVALDVLGDKEEAVRALTRLLELRPDHEWARATLESTLESSARWAELLELYRERIVRSEDPEARAEWYLRAARLELSGLEDATAALDTIETLLGERPADAGAMDFLESVAAAHESHRLRAVDILEPIYVDKAHITRLVEISEWRLSQSTDPERRHQLYLRLAELHSARDGGADDAFNALARALAEPGPESCLTELDAAAAALVDKYNAHQPFAAVLEQAAASEALANDVDRRANLLIAASSRALKAELNEDAARLARASLELRANDPDALALLDQSLRGAGDPTALAAVLEERIEASEDDEQRVDLLRRLARLYEDRLKDEEKAQRSWTRLLEVDSSDGEALKKLSAIYEKAGNAPKLIDMLERRIAVSESGGMSGADAGTTAAVTERLDLRRRLAAVHREQTGDRGAEVEVLRSLLGEHPTDVDALAQLDVALRTLERWGEAVEVIGERAALAQGAAQAALHGDAAEILERSLVDVAAAVERYGIALQADPSDARATAALVRLAADPDASEFATQTVRPVLESQGGFAALAQVLEARCRLTGDAAERLDALRELAGIRYERLHDVSGALESTRMLLDLTPIDELEGIVSATLRLAQELGQVSEQIQDLSERSGPTLADGSPREPELRVALAMHASSAAQDMLGDAARASQPLIGLLDAGLSDPAALERLAALATQASDPLLAERAIRAHLELGLDSIAQARLYIQLGEVRIHAQRLDDAAAALIEASELVEASRDEEAVVLGRAALRGMEYVLENSPAPSTALLDALESVYAASGDQSGMAKITQIRLRTGGGMDDDRRAELLKALAEQLYAANAPAAEVLEAYGGWLSADPEGEGAIGAFANLCEAPELAARGGQLTTQAITAARARGRCPFELVVFGLRLLGLRLGQYSEVRDLLGEEISAQLEDPRAEELLDAWCECAEASGDAVWAHGALALAARHAATPARAAQRWGQAAANAHQRGDKALAIEDLRALIDADDNDAQGWDALLRLLEEAGDGTAYAEALERRLLNCPDDARDAMRLTLARVLAGIPKRARVEDAVSAYRDLLESETLQDVAIMELEALFRATEQWGELRELMERRADRASGDDRFAILDAMAKLAENRLQDVQDAIEIHRRVLMEAPGRASTEAALERLFTSEEAWGDLASLLEDRVAAARMSGQLEVLRPAASRLAGLLARELQDAERAQEILTELLDVDPNYAPALLALADVYEARGDEGAMRLTLQRAAETNPTGKEGAALARRLAALAPDEASKVTQLERALQLDPTDHEAADALLEIAKASGRWQTLVSLLDLRASQTEDADERRSIALEQVDIITERLGDPDRALAILAKIYEEVNEDVEVNRRIADALFSSGSLEEAGPMYEWLIDVVSQKNKRDKSLAHYSTRLARVSLHRGDDAAALTQFEASFKIDSTSVETMIYLGQAYERAARWADALKIYRTMLLQNADQSGLLRRGDIYERLAAAHIGLGEKPKAQAMLRRGIEEDPEHPGLSATLSTLN